MKTVFISIAYVLLLTCCTSNKIVEKQAAPNPTPQQQTKLQNKVLGTYSTKLLDRKKERLRNIDLAIEEINKITIQPGEVFSFNDVVGPRTQARGFQKALIIIKKEKVMGYGGGICQVSTTIYNAALGAGLEIVERHQHDNEIGYVELGDDATVSYGSLDLKIKNNKDIPIKFRAGVGENTIDATVITSF